MAEQEIDPGLAPKPSNKLPLIIVVVVVLFALIGAGVMIASKKEEPKLHQQAKPAEYSVKERMYQLKDGAYLKLSFSIVVDQDKMLAVKTLLEASEPGRLPNGLNMLMGNKTRADLISGTHKREALAREIKKVLEDQVFREYNQQQASPQDAIEIREVLISDFVTQSG